MSDPRICPPKGSILIVLISIFCSPGFAVFDGMLIFNGLTGDEVLLSLLGRLSLGGEDVAGLSGSSLELVVLLNSLKEVKSGSRLSQMLESDVDSLLDDSISKILIDNDTD